MADGIPSLPPSHVRWVMHSIQRGCINLLLVQITPPEFCPLVFFLIGDIPPTTRFDWSAGVIVSLGRPPQFISAVLHRHSSHSKFAYPCSLASLLWFGPVVGFFTVLHGLPNHRKLEKIRDIHPGGHFRSQKLWSCYVYRWCKMWRIVLPSRSSTWSCGVSLYCPFNELQGSWY